MANILQLRADRCKQFRVFVAQMGWWNVGVVCRYPDPPQIVLHTDHALVGRRTVDASIRDRPQPPLQCPSYVGQWKRLICRLKAGPHESQVDHFKRGKATKFTTKTVQNASYPRWKQKITRQVDLTNSNFWISSIYRAKCCIKTDSFAEM